MDEAEREVRLARVASIRPVAIDVVRFELEPADRRPFAPFTPGAHIDLTTPAGPVRQYSLCGDPTQPKRYAIAVKREREGRGGSASLHEGVVEGSALAFSGPRNLFPLAPRAGASLLVAGGIGVTPVYAMAQSLAASGRPWEMHYCARSREHAAFFEELAALPGGALHTYFSEMPLLDARALLREVRTETDVYCCGPAPLMQAVKEAGAHWPAERLHFEYFAAPAIDWPPNQPFEIELARSHAVLQVPRDRSILQVLRANGVEVASACEEGVCGTCEVRVLDGIPEHRDVLLNDAEKAAGKTIMTCVSRARSPRLVLDL
jgi:vanillate O-demethylase ferredoxin subunit